MLPAGDSLAASLTSSLNPPPNGSALVSEFGTTQAFRTNPRTGEAYSRAKRPSKSLLVMSILSSFFSLWPDLASQIPTEPRGLRSMSVCTGPQAGPGVRLSGSAVGLDGLLGRRCGTAGLSRAGRAFPGVQAHCSKSQSNTSSVPEKTCRLRTDRYFSNLSISNR